MRALKKRIKIPRAVSTIFRYKIKQTLQPTLKEQKDPDNGEYIEWEDSLQFITLSCAHDCEF
jgi:hypothetical protein